MGVERTGLDGHDEDHVGLGGGAGLDDTLDRRLRLERNAGADAQGLDVLQQRDGLGGV